MDLTKEQLQDALEAALRSLTHGDAHPYRRRRFSDADKQNGVEMPAAKIGDRFYTFCSYDGLVELIVIGHCGKIPIIIETTGEGQNDDVRCQPYLLEAKDVHSTVEQAVLSGIREDIRSWEEMLARPKKLLAIIKEHGVDAVWADELWEDADR